jgi:hypothetical protein
MPKLTQLIKGAFLGLLVIRGLLQDPNEGFPEATHLFKTDRARYYAIVEEWTRMYAIETRVAGS